MMTVPHLWVLLTALLSHCPCFSVFKNLPFVSVPAEMGALWWSWFFPFKSPYTARVWDSVFFFSTNNAKGQQEVQKGAPNTEK